MFYQFNELRISTLNIHRWSHLHTELCFCTLSVHNQLSTYLPTYLMHTYIHTYVIQTYVIHNTYIHNCHPATLYNLRTNCLPAYQPNFLENIHFETTCKNKYLNLFFYELCFMVSLMETEVCCIWKLNCWRTILKCQSFILTNVHTNCTKLQIIHTHELF